MFDTGISKMISKVLRTEEMVQNEVRKLVKITHRKLFLAKIDSRTALFSLR